MASRNSTEPGFKSRFSRFSVSALFPSRHPPLVISHPQPLPQYLPRHPVISNPSPVESTYPSPETMRASPSIPPKRPKKRPPPLDMAKVHAMYPAKSAVNEAAPVVGASLVPAARPLRPAPPRLDTVASRSLQEGKVEKVKEKKDFFADDGVELEGPHKYPAWKGGKVDIRPGEVIPRIIVPPIPQSPPRRKRANVKSSMTTHTIPEQHYDSVLHNVLLTPTYLASTPSLPSSSHSSRRVRRKTLIDRATDTIGAAARGARSSRLLRGILKMDPGDAEESMRRLREREAAEMDRFRRQAAPLASADSLRDNDRVIRGMPSYRGRALRGDEDDSDSGTSDEEQGRRRKREQEWLTWNQAAMEGGHGWNDQVPDPLGEKGIMGWWSRRKEAERKKKEAAKLKRQRRIKMAIIILFGLLIAAAVTLSTYFLTRPPAAPRAQNPSNATSTFTPSSTLASTSAQPSTTSSISRTLQACLDQYSTLTTPASYPCSECVPLLASTPNDFASPLQNGNSTGVGSALQFCALMDIYQNTGGGSSSGLSSGKWAQTRNVCGWQGVACNPRGMVTELSMTYPNVPDTLPSTLNNIISLSVLRLLGNSSVPAGPFPSGVLTSTLQTLDLQYTAINGPIAQADWSVASQLGTLYLANNTNLGTTLPDLSSNGKLVTLAATGQGITQVASDKLPSSLTYLDLSYNAIGGQVPSFAPLTSLRTLFLQNNALVLAPSSLPASIVTVSLTGNPNLSGNMASSICLSSNMTSCDLRGTNLGGSTATSSSSSASASSSSASASSSAGTSAVSPGKVCGVCRYS